MNDSKKEKENIRRKLDQGILKTCCKPTTATASWWKTFVRIQDEKENIIPYVQCMKCLSILAYDSSKTGSSTHKLHAENCLGGGTSSSSRNQDIAVMMAKDRNLFAGAKSSFVDALAKFCSFDLRPFEVVTGTGFEIMCQSLLDIAHQNPHLINATDIIPDSTTVSRRVKNLAEEHRLELIQTLLGDLEKIKLFGVTTDFWKNKFSSNSYLTITLHYNKEGEMKNLVLKTVHVSESKNGENTKKLIWNVLKSFGIDPDVFQIIYVTDNGSNLISALSGEAHMRCVCHCINLAIKQSIDECSPIDQLASACRELVCHFKRCELQHSITTTLKQDVCTRWNSTYDTLWSIWLSFDEVEGILGNRDEAKYLSNIDRYVVKDVTDLLSVFKIGSEKLSADDVPTLHSVLPWFTKFKKTCEPKNTDRPCIAELKKKILSKLDDKIWITEIHYIATFLHPETKSLSSLPEKSRNEVLKSVKTMFQTTGIDEESSDLTLLTDKRQKKRNKRAKRNDISVDDVLKEFVNNQDSSSNDEEKFDEVMEYLKLKVNFQTGEDLLAWWKKHSTIFPKLSRLAAALLSIPASSTTSERVFSETGRILEARRQQLSPESLDSLVFLRNFR